MIKLRVVGYSDDLQNLILSKPGARRGSHVTPIDDRLFDVLEDVWRARKGADRADKRTRDEQPPVDPKLAPRDVQRMLRAGVPTAQVAELAGVDVAWVEKFASMILHERAGAIADSQNLLLEKPKLGVSGLPLGESVLANLRSRRVRLDEEQLADAWDATRQDGQPWVISLEFPFRGRRQRATWRYDPHARTITAANRLAADLGWVKNGKKLARATAARSEAAAAGGARAAKTKPTRSSAKKRAATKRRPAAKKRAAGKKRVAARRRPAAKRPAAKKRTAVKRRRPVKRPAARARRARPRATRRR